MSTPGRCPLRRAQQDFSQIAERHDLTAQQARTLLFLDELQPMSQIADHLHCDASNVTGLADRLERRGAIERLAGPDGRVRLLSLTAEGRQLRERLADDVATGSTVAARLGSAERRQLSGLLDKLLTDSSP